MALEISIREGVRQMLESIPSVHYSEILAYTQKVPLRPGFEQFLYFLDDRGVPFVVVSGGLRGMVDASLGSLASRVHKIFAADVNTRGEYLKVTSDFEGDMELVAKVDVMNLFGEGQRIAIGDGATDINMAKQASLVFARGSLAFFLDHMDIPYRKWSDFLDVQKALEALWQE
jgi:2-hydroxy-3-keto-5-methylthiopentenyl-1-phosphate phosphatase